MQDTFIFLVYRALHCLINFQSQSHILLFSLSFNHIHSFQQKEKLQTKTFVSINKVIFTHGSTKRIEYVKTSVWFVVGGCVQNQISIGPHYTSRQGLSNTNTSKRMGSIRDITCPIQSHLQKNYRKVKNNKMFQVVISNFCDMSLVQAYSCQV